jgi:hypothetical protein
MNNFINLEKLEYVNKKLNTQFSIFCQARTDFTQDVLYYDVFEVKRIIHFGRIIPVLGMIIDYTHEI